MEKITENSYVRDARERHGVTIETTLETRIGAARVTLGPSVAAFGRGRGAPTIQENQLFSLEYAVHTNLPERPGFPISINIEGNLVATSRGVEILHPLNNNNLVIH